MPSTATTATFAPGRRRAVLPWGEFDAVSDGNPAILRCAYDSGAFLAAESSALGLGGRLSLDGASIGEPRYAGEIGGESAWACGDWRLFHSASRGKWLLAPSFAEPAFTEIEYTSWDGSSLATDTAWLGAALFYELSGFPFPYTGGSAQPAPKTVQATPLGSSLDPDDDDVSAVDLVYTPPPVWELGSGGAASSSYVARVHGILGICGEYAPVAGTGATGTLVVGRGAWRCAAKGLVLFERGDGAGLCAAQETGASALPGDGNGGIVVATGEGGRWAASGQPDNGSGFTAAWQWDEGAGEGEEAPDGLSFAWLGYCPFSDTSSDIYAYQAGRLL